MQMTIMSEGLPLNSNHIKPGLLRFNHLTVIHLRLFNRKNSLGDRGFGL